MSSRRRLLRSLLPMALLTTGAAYAVASWNWCGRWEERPPVLLGQVRGEGPLRAGAAKVEILPPFPVVVAGRPPPRAEARQSDPPVHARAVVLAAGDVRVGLVSLELLNAPASLVEGLRARAAGLGLQGVLVFATHTHSSFGGFDERLMAQLAGTGRFRAAAVEAAVSAGAEALRKAADNLSDVTLEVGRAQDAALVYTRSGGETPDGALTRVVLRGAAAPVAELLVFGAHPTLVPRERGYVDPDYPGRLSELREAGGGVTLVMQGAAGNASVAFSDGRHGVERAAGFAQALADLAGRAELVQSPGPARLALARAEVTLPRPDASRLVPAFTRAAGDNFLCHSAPRTAEVGALALGPLRLLLVPAEPTVDAGAELARRTGATGLLGLADGYISYVDTEARVREASGESLRQYFGPGLLERLGSGAQLAAEAAGFTREP
ncbi:hypothetical protein P2318_05390 [Myxococcaceae bacterium GXIMD 01537]